MSIEILCYIIIALLVITILVLFFKKGNVQTDNGKIQELDQKLNQVYSSLKNANDNTIKAMNMILQDNKTNYNSIIDQNRSNNRDIQDKIIQNHNDLVNANQRNYETIVQENKQNYDNTVKSLSERNEDSYSLLRNVEETIVNINKIFSKQSLYGALGENQLENILSITMSKPTQFDTQYKLKDDLQERVDFIIKIPDNGKTTILPIDSKFPKDKFVKVLEAKDNDELDKARKDMLSYLKSQAKSIGSKYIIPDITTDFCLLFVPSDAILDECYKEDSFVDKLYKDEKVILVSPTSVVPIIDILCRYVRQFKILDEVKDITIIYDALKDYNQSVQKEIRTINKSLNNLKKLSQGLSDKYSNEDEDGIDDTTEEEKSEETIGGLFKNLKKK